MKNSVIALFLSLALLLPLSPIYSAEKIEITRTDWNQLKTELTKLENSNQQKQKLLIELKATNEKNLEDLKNLQSLNQQMKETLEKSEISLKESKKKIIFNNIKWFSVGLGAGFIAGTLIFIR